MKKFLKLFSVIAVAAIALTGCNKNETPVDLVQKGVEKSVRFSVKSDNPATKSYFGEKRANGYPTIWTDSKKVAISMNYSSKRDADVTPLTEGLTAQFDATFTDDASGEYSFYALSPSTAAKSISGGTYKSWGVEFPASQIPTETSVDEAAHILAGKSMTYTGDFPEQVEVEFEHIAAYCRFQLKNFRETATIESIDIASDEPFAGRFYYYIEDAEQEAGTFKANTTSNNITLNVASLPGINNDKDYWFACKPVDLEGKNLKFTLNTSDGKFVKTITFPTGTGNFQKGRVATFKVNMEGISPEASKIYRLVTDYTQLTEDTEVIIVAANSDFAISTTQNSNNRAQAAITKNVEDATVVNPSDAVQRFILEVGTIENTVAFLCSGGDKDGQYIGSVSGQNYLRSFAPSADIPSGAQSFNITLENDGTATIVGNEGQSRQLRYNTSGLFACYLSGQQPVAIYAITVPGSKIVEPVTPDPVISYDTNTQTVYITCSEPSAKIGYTIDGTEPGIDDSGNPVGSTQLYTGSFTITTTTTVKAFAGADHMLLSNVVSKLCEVSVAPVGTVVWSDDFSVATGYTARTSLSGSNSSYEGDYSGLSRIYNMAGALKLGTASNTGTITTPVLTSITGTSANLTITFTSAGWNNKSCNVTLSASKGTVTEGVTSVSSESTMSGNSPSMTGTTYTFHVTGADNTTTITISSNMAIGLDNLLIVQTN